jgi:hypothetical protein
MKNLFTVYKTHFQNKMEAKQHRDQTGHTLTKGPDHMGNNGNGKKARNPERCGMKR